MDNITPEAASFLRDVKDSVIAQFPAEKRQAERDIIATGKALQAEGSVVTEGLGQKMGSIPGRVYHRWQLMLPGCWQDKNFVLEFLQDNPGCRAPGYRATPTSIRNGVSFYQANKHKVA